MANKSEGLRRRGLVEEETIGKANYTSEYNTAAKDSALVLCGLYSQRSCVAHYFPLDFNFALVKPQRFKDNFRQDDFTNVCENISIFLQDRYN